MRTSLILISSLATAIAYGQTFPKVKAVKLTQLPVIDGVMQPGEWDTASRCETFTDRVTSKPTGDQSVGFLAYDDQAIYWAMIVKESKPNQITAREIQPGANFDNDDHVRLDINPFHTRSYNGTSSFSVNAIGNTSEEISGGRAAKREWRGEWTAKVTRTADGWVMEARIPWKVLNYPGGKSMHMDFNMTRYQSWSKIYSEYAPLSQQGKAEYRAEWLDVAPPAVGIEKPWSFLAYAAPEYDKGNSGARAGIDARYRFTETVTGLVSYNPDFRNIEGQIAGIEFTRTERYIDDVRPFFTEGAGYFGFGAEHGFGQMFYSQRIPTFDVGAKAFGQLNRDWSVGALATYDRNAQSVGIAKVRREFGPNGNIEAFASASQDDNRQDQSLGTQAFVKRGNLAVSTSLAASRKDEEKFSSVYEGSVSYGAPHVFTVFQYEAIQPNFNPALGYVPWTDRKGYYQYTDFGKQMRTGPFRFVGGDFFWREFFTYDGQVQEKGWSTFQRVRLRNDSSFGLGHEEVFYYGDPDNVWSANLRFNESNRFRNFGIYYERGLRGGKPSEYLSLGLSRRIGKGLDVSFNQSVNKYQGTDRLTVATVGYELNSTESINGRFVTRNGHSNAYLAYRKSGGKGTEYFVILGDPNAEETVSRISLKAVWAF